MNGYFEIGIYHTKTASNVGTLWRSAYQLGASGIFTIGKRYPQQASDTIKTDRLIPMREYLNFDDFFASVPKRSRTIGIEMGGKPLSKVHHPDQAVYILGAEDYGLPDGVSKRCNMVVSIEADRIDCYNVAVAGSIIMYHRYLTRELLGKGEDDGR